jgi:hypothetical protein
MTDTPAQTRKIGEPLPKFASIDEASAVIITAVMTLFCIFCPEEKSRFTDLILDPALRSVLEPDRDEPETINITVYSDHSKTTYQYYMRLMAKSCASALSAPMAEQDGKEVEAWSLIGNAQYFLGLLEGLVLVEPVLVHANTERGKSGATKRDAKFEPLRDLARKLAGKKSYPSKRNAALSIKDEVLAAAKDHEIALSEMQAERTITGWLDGMLFGSKR